MTLDKQAHFFAGAAIASTVTLYLGDPSYGLVAGAVAGLLKELIDSKGYGSPDLKDALATLLGAYVVIPAFFI